MIESGSPRRNAIGAWGTAIFSDDLAADLRDDFKELIGDGLSPEDATARLCKRHADSLEDVDERSVFWIALASVQWHTGRLVPTVRDRALEAIESGENLRKWEEEAPTSVKLRKGVLEALQAKLLSPPPAPKKIPKRFRSSNDWPVGMIVAYRLTSGSLCLFRVTDHHSDKGGTDPIVEILDWTGQEIPSKLTIRMLRGRPAQKAWNADKLMIGAVSAREFPKERVQVTGFIVPRSPIDIILQRFKPKKHIQCSVTLWRYLDRHLKDLFGLE